MFICLMFIWDHKNLPCPLPHLTLPRLLIPIIMMIYTFPNLFKHMFNTRKQEWWLFIRVYQKLKTSSCDHLAEKVSHRKENLVRCYIFVFFSEGRGYSDGLYEKIWYQVLLVNWRYTVFTEEINQIQNDIVSKEKSNSNIERENRKINQSNMLWSDSVI